MNEYHHQTLLTCLVYSLQPLTHKVFSVFGPQRIEVCHLPHAENGRYYLSRLDIEYRQPRVTSNDDVITCNLILTRLETLALTLTGSLTRQESSFNTEAYHGAFSWPR